MSSPKEQALIRARKLKEEGNALFGQKSCQKAIDKYRLACSSIKQYIDANSNQVLSDYETLYVQCLSNQSQCNINIGNYATG